MTTNFYAMDTGQLQERLKVLKHAGAIETIVDSEGHIIRETKHHYLGCTRCLIEDIIRQRTEWKVAAD